MRITKNKLLLTILTILTLFFSSCSNDEKIITVEKKQNKKIAFFQRFENQLFSSKEASSNYAKPFAECAEAYFKIHPQKKTFIENNYGTIDVKVSSQTIEGDYEDRRKLLFFPILKNGIVKAVIAGVVNAKRDYLYFNIYQNEHPDVVYLLNKFQQHYKTRTNAKSDTTELNEIVITVRRPIQLSQFDGWSGNGGLGSSSALMGGDGSTFGNYVEGGSSTVTNNNVSNNYINTKIWEETRINPNALQPCMKTILNDIKKLQNGSVGQIIQKFAGNIPGYNWEMKDGYANGNPGSTNPPTNYNSATGTIISTFDTTSFPDASELSWARTILHEGIHAYLSVYFATNRPGFMGNYSNMVTDWGILKNWEAVHHEEFARTLVTEIANSLQQYALLKGYNLPRQFYDDMAWAGLQGTSIFQNLPSPDKTRILNIIAVELTGMDMNGNSQTQKGQPSGC